MLRMLDTGGILFDGGAISDHGILARTITIDSQVQKLLAEHPNTVVINAGAGLDTRKHRLNSKPLHWYDLDLEPVAKLRSRFFDYGEHETLIAKSILDFSWIDAIDVPAHAHVLLIAEGLLMYFSTEDVCEILTVLCNAFPNAHMLFDVVHHYFVKKGISSPFLFGIDHAKDMQDLVDTVQILDAWATGDLLQSRQPLWLRLMNCLPSTRKRSQIIHAVLRKPFIS